MLKVLILKLLFLIKDLLQLLLFIYFICVINYVKLFSMFKQFVFIISNNFLFFIYLRSFQHIVMVKKMFRSVNNKYRLNIKLVFFYFFLVNSCTKKYSKFTRKFANNETNRLDDINK